MDVKSKIAFFEAKSSNNMESNVKKVRVNATRRRPKTFDGFLTSIYEDKSNEILLKKQSEACKVNRKHIRRKHRIFEDESNSEDCRLNRTPSLPKKKWNLLFQNWKEVALKDRNLALSVT